jgi:SAM-dependent methyltransferase
MPQVDADGSSAAIRRRNVRTGVDRLANPGALAGLITFRETSPHAKLAGPMPVSKRSLVEQLTRPELQAIADEHALVVEDRRVRDHLIDAAVSARKVSMADVLATYPRDRLKELCRALGLDDTGKEKVSLVERLVGANGRDSATYTVPPASDHVLKAGERAVAYEPLLRRDGVSVKPRRKTKERTWPRRRTGGYESEAVVSGSLKAALRKLALGAAGGYRGREAQLSFTTHLLECFGWPHGRPPGAEIPRVFSIADAGRRAEREVPLWWPERRTLMEVAAHDAVLDVAWKDLVRVCLQLDPIPQYVVLTNQRDLQLYDLARDREAPRLSIPIDDLPKYSEAFPFFTAEWKPGAVPKIVNVEKVSSEVADLVARLYLSVLARHPKREHDVIRFTLQCITAMFAEDIGLLPKNYFTSLLYDGAKRGNVERRIRELFEQMNTCELPAPRVVPYFNGGLFTDAVTLPLGPEQVIALTKAAEANWTYVDPHIFGSVFQGIMDDAERHAQGAHYTAQEDIMRVVGPTIVEPWRKRIQAATSLKELTELRKELFAYRVLDPACGSGNFLYVAFRELYRLDTELLSRMREFPSTAGKLSWNGGISASNFFGIDINPFAVELAKVTLNIAKKIAYEERKAQAFALAGQVEMDLDPSLPLDNLDENIVCADALFTEWPDADAIVSNPPFLGGTKIREELGTAYLQRLRDAFPEVHGKADYCVYWFRRAHDHLPHGARAGLVGTQSIRLAKTREASLDYIIQRGGTITNAVSSRPWPGEAVVTVSMVNWVHGPASGPFRLEVDGHSLEQVSIAPHLQLHADTTDASVIGANGFGTIQGVQFGTTAFEVPAERVPEIARDHAARRYLRPVVTADELLRGQAASAPSFVIDMTACETENEAQAGGSAYQYLREHVLPFVKRKALEATTSHYKNWLETWWRPRTPRAKFFSSITNKTRLIVCSCHASRPIFVFVSRVFVPTHSLQVFAFDDDYSFGIIQSNAHWRWAVLNGSKIEERIRYLTPVWETFPWPQEPSENEVEAVASAARELRRVRKVLMTENGWSLRALHQAAEISGPHPLKSAQDELDHAVCMAYGMPTGQEATEFLLELNKLVAEDEAQGRKVRGPGLPDYLDPKDPRFTSSDCIEPPERK